MKLDYPGQKVYGLFRLLYILPFLGMEFMLIYLFKPLTPEAANFTKNLALVAFALMVLGATVVFFVMTRYYKKYYQFPDGLSDRVPTGFGIYLVYTLFLLVGTVGIGIMDKQKVVGILCVIGCTALYVAAIEIMLTGYKSEYKAAFKRMENQISKYMSGMGVEISTESRVLNNLPIGTALLQLEYNDSEYNDALYSTRWLVIVKTGSNEYAVKHTDKFNLLLKGKKLTVADLHSPLKLLVRPKNTGTWLVYNL